MADGDGFSCCPVLRFIAEPGLPSSLRDGFNNSRLLCAFTVATYKMAKEKYGLAFHPERQDKIVYRAYFPAPL
ncbi:hypothetical protein U9M48_019856 [Paspalum notatum var. saurae]|uniref:Uncharacterized protein n=1 Tax=Paspalum notatum var. saurae TaxID=547442 RepID=A0AAQ3TGD7_PASNO